MSNEIKHIERVSLPVVRVKIEEEFGLFSNKPIKTPNDVIDLVGSYIGDLAHENAVVVCFNAELCPLCVSIIGMGDLHETHIPIRNIIETAILADADAIAVIHNHPDAIISNANVGASLQDLDVAQSIIKACGMMRIFCYDFIIVTQQKQVNGPPKQLYYSLKEKKVGIWKKALKDKYEKGIIKTTFTSDSLLKWNDDKDNSRYWGFDVAAQKIYPQLTAYTPEELKMAVELIRSGKLEEYSNKKERITISTASNNISKEELEKKSLMQPEAMQLYKKIKKQEEEQQRILQELEERGEV